MGIKDYLLGACLIIVLAAVIVTVVMVLRYERHPHHTVAISQSNLHLCLQNLGNGGC